MKSSEYRLLEEAYAWHFGFMLNRLEHAGWLSTTGTERDRQMQDDLLDRAFNEFKLALDEMGIELQDVEVPVRCGCHVRRRYKKENQ